MTQAMQYDVQAIVTSETAPYHRFLREGRLKMQCCVDCAHVRHPARPFCPECLSPRYGWKECDGIGTVEAFVWYLNDVYDANYDSTWAWRDIPYNVAIVQLSGGVTVISNVIGSSFEALRPGQTVQPVFVPISDEFGVLRFKPAE
jgi:uncharacterized OB-fold protein